MINIALYEKIDIELHEKLWSISEIHASINRTGMTMDNYEIDNNLIYVSTSNNLTGCGENFGGFDIVKTDINEPIEFFEKYFGDIILKRKAELIRAEEKKKEERKTEKEEKDRLDWIRLKKKYIDDTYL